MIRLTPEYFFKLDKLAFKDFLASQKAVWDAIKFLADYLESQISKKIISKDCDIHPSVSISGKNVLINQGVIIKPFVSIDASSGPVWIGNNTKILTATHIRGPAIIGRNCSVNGEIKNSIILDEAHSDHSPNYIGDSIVGGECRLGCGTVLSNRRFDRKEITIKIGKEIVSTGLHRLGAVLGDKVKTGCNSVIGPGALVGPDTWIGQQTQINNEYIKENKLVRLNQNRKIMGKK